MKKYYFNNKTYPLTGYIKLLFAYFLVFAVLGINAQEYGLKFKGQKFLLDERTSLDLSPDNFIKLGKEFEMSFDLNLSIDKYNNEFGYIFRLISKKNKNIDLLLTKLKNKSLLTLVIGNEKINIPLNIKETFLKDWINVSFKILLDKNELYLNINKKEYLKKTATFKGSKAYKILFGANNYDVFATSDVPEIIVKDIKLYNRGTLTSHFPLKQCGGNQTEDIVKNKKATISNPDWILCNHKNWKLDFKSEVIGAQLVAADEENGIIFFLSNSAIFKYKVSNKSIEKTPYTKEVSLTLNHKVIYNKNDKKIYCYLKDRQQVAKLDIDSGIWSNLETFSKKENKEAYQKHNTVFNAKENAIYTFGGYGNYKYKNKVGKLNLTDTTWVSLSEHDSIFKPRYLAGADILNDSIYILGGYGSASGSQLVNPKSYFNLIAYDLKSNTFIEKFKIKPHLSDMIVASKMWVNPKDRSYFALISDKIKFNGQSRLLKGSLDSPKTIILGDSIPYKFLDVKSISKLYFMPNEKKLVAYNSYLNKENKTEFNIYSINFPVIQIDQETPENKNNLVFFGVGFILVGFILLFIINKKRVKTNNTPQKPDTTEEITEKSYIPIKTTSKLKYQIIFFGGFQIIDKDENDITGKFSPLLKELFLLIWLYTFKNDKGISSAKLMEYLWYDKSPRKAQNNRSVNITKLRALLKKVGDVQITKETGYWKITNDDKNLRSDHFDLLQMVNDKKNITQEKIDHIIKISQKGPFLSNLDYEWLEPIKQDISDKIIIALISFAENFNIKNDPDFILHLCDCVFNFDSISEEAVIFKCKAYNYKGNHSLAESTFKKFLKEYKLLYDQDYQYSFQEILHKEM